MTPLFKKLNYKAFPEICILNPPQEMNEEMKEMSKLCYVNTNEVTQGHPIQFILVFVTKLNEIEQSIQKIFPELHVDALLWYAYPKSTSKKYTCEFNRDNGFQAIGKYNLEPVRMVAIDENWSALRFRKVEYIKKFTRHNAMILSEKGKERKK